MAVDFKSLGINTQGALGAGALTLLFSFFSSFNTVDLGRFGSAGFSAWHSYATFGLLLIIAGIAIIAVKAFAAESLPTEVPWSLAALILVGIGTILVILRGLTYEVANPGWSGYLVFIGSIALTYFAFASFKESGEKMPEFNKPAGNAPSAGGTPPAATPPPPPAGGTTPPPPTPPAGENPPPPPPAS